MASFYRLLKAWRLHRSLTQAQIAERSGISRPNLVALEQGRRECTLSTLQRLAFALGVTPGMLLDREPPQTVVGELGRHEIDRIARSFVTKGKKLPENLLAIRDGVALQAGPLLRAAGIKERRRRGRKRMVPDKRAVEQVLRRLAKLLPHYVAETGS